MKKWKITLKTKTALQNQRGKLHVGKYEVGNNAERTLTTERAGKIERKRQRTAAEPWQYREIRRETGDPRAISKISHRTHATITRIA